jgi:regulator of sirC expression with transglutaminase-like and TPR domain
MIPRSRIITALLVLAGWALADSPQCSAQEPPDESPQITRLIGLLDADRFEDRQRAMRALYELGLPAVEPLQGVREHPSAEVRWRAKAVIDALTVGVLRRELAEFAALPDERLDLEHGMWLIARILHPGVKKEGLTKSLDELAARVRRRLGKDASPVKSDPERVVAALRHVLFVEEGFTGNVSDRYHPDNSSLARVLATKKGLPILLSHLTIAVARRLDVPIVGVPLSGTYIVKYDGTRAPQGFSQKDIFIDPFEQGRVLRPGEEIERAFPGQDAASVPPLENRETLARMLRNLSSPPLLAERKPYEWHALAEEFLQLLAAYAPEAAP